jgi:hypothetical protein
MQLPVDSLFGEIKGLSNRSRLLWAKFGDKFALKGPEHRSNFTELLTKTDHKYLNAFIGRTKRRQRISGLQVILGYPSKMRDLILV